jgi:hypothetical protein
MNRITLGQGIIVAAIFALLSAAAFAALTLLMAPTLLLKAMIVVLNAAYLGVLMKRSKLRRGRLALPLAWLVAAIAIGLWAPGLAAYVILHTGLLWLSRTLCCHTNVLSRHSSIWCSAPSPWWPQSVRPCRAAAYYSAFGASF